MKVLLSIIVASALALAVSFGLADPVNLYEQFAPQVGTFNITGGGTYRLQTSLGSANTTLTLSSFKEPVSNIPYTMSYLQTDIIFGTLDPQNPTRKEFISATGITQNSDGTATLTGVTRGLTFTPDITNGCTASSTLAQSHSGQSIFILSDSPCLFTKYLNTSNVATSSNVVFFSSTTPPRYDSTANQKNGTYNATTSEFASIDYVNAVSFSGTSNATESVKGIVELGTAREVASSTPTGSTAASLVLQARYATDTPQYGCATGFSTAGAGCSVIAQLTGKIKQAWLNLAESFTFTAGLTSTATTTLAASNVNSNALVINTLAYAFPSTRAASSTVLTEDGTGALKWLTPQVYVLTAGGGSNSSSNSTTSLATIKIPANTLVNAQAYVTVKANYAQVGASTCYTDIGIGTGTATTSFFFMPTSGSGGGAASSIIDMSIMATSSTGVAAGATGTFMTNADSAPGGAPYSMSRGIGLVSRASVIYVSLGSRSPSSTSCGYDFYTAEVHNF